MNSSGLELWLQISFAVKIVSLDNFENQSLKPKSIEGGSTMGAIKKDSDGIKYFIKNLRGY